MGFLSFFLGEKKQTATVAKERLQLILCVRLHLGLHVLCVLRIIRPVNLALLPLNLADVLDQCLLLLRRSDGASSCGNQVDLQPACCPCKQQQQQTSHPAASSHGPQMGAARSLCWLKFVVRTWSP